MFVPTQVALELDDPARWPRLHSGTGLSLRLDAPWVRHSRWLTVITIDPAHFGADLPGVVAVVRAQCAALV